MVQDGAPPVLSWFIIPLTVDISTISPSEIGVINQHHLVLVGGLEHVLFSHILGIIIPIDALIFFRCVGIPPTISIEYP